MDEGKEKAIKKWNEIFFLRCAVASRGYTLCVENDQSPGRKVDLLFTEGQVGEDRFHIVLSGEDFFFLFCVAVMYNLPLGKSISSIIQ